MPCRRGSNCRSHQRPKLEAGRAARGQCRLPGPRHVDLPHDPQGQRPSRSTAVCRPARARAPANVAPGQGRTNPNRAAGRPRPPLWPNQFRSRTATSADACNACLAAVAVQTDLDLFRKHLMPACYLLQPRPSVTRRHGPLEPNQDVERTPPIGIFEQSEGAALPQSRPDRLRLVRILLCPALVAIMVV